MILPHHYCTLCKLGTNTHTQFFCQSFCLDEPFPITQGWMSLLSISTSSTVSTLPCSFSSDTHSHTHNLTIFLSLSHTLSNTQVHKLTLSHTTAKHTLCSHTSSWCTRSHKYTPHTHTQKLINTDASAATGASRPLWRANTIKQSVSH